MLLHMLLIILEYCLAFDKLYASISSEYSHILSTQHLLLSLPATTTKTMHPRNAHFQPTYPLSLYLHGTAGAGKSSLVRNLIPAINVAIQTHCDPELLVRFVKQNLNKPYKTLQLELDLRPNNNDYSVMSIIQGRRMTLSQSKPGLVLVALEEMPSNLEGADPKQAEVSRLLSMRFSGRKGDTNCSDMVESVAPRNSEKRGLFMD